MAVKGQVALVTGGTRGIGAAITKALARDGRYVAAGYSKGGESAQKLKAELRGEGRHDFDPSGEGRSGRRLPPRCRRGSGEVRADRPPYQQCRDYER